MLGEYACRDRRPDQSAVPCAVTGFLLGAAAFQSVWAVIDTGNLAERPRKTSATSLSPAVISSAAHEPHYGLVLGATF
jgi:hypothetical protein